MTSYESVTNAGILATTAAIASIGFGKSHTNVSIVTISAALASLGFRGTSFNGLLRYQFAFAPSIIGMTAGYLFSSRARTIGYPQGADDENPLQDELNSTAAIISRTMMVVGFGLYRACTGNFGFATFAVPAVSVTLTAFQMYILNDMRPFASDILAFRTLSAVISFVVALGGNYILPAPNKTGTYF